MGKTLFILGASLAGLAVILGAFGAHGLKSMVTPERLLVFETGVRYHFFHAFAILIVGWMVNQGMVSFSPAGWLFFAGIIIFSGSLYILVLTDTAWLGAITPIGGVAMIAGWVYLAYAGWKSL